MERGPGGPGPDDLGVLMGAAEEAMATEPARAVYWLRWALTLAPASARTSLLLALIRALVAAGVPIDGRDLLHDLLRTDPPQPWEVRARALRFGALAECLLGRGKEAAELVAATLAGTPENPPLAMVRLAVIEGVLSALEGAEPTPGAADLAIRIAREHGDRMGEAGALAVRAFGGGTGPVIAKDLDAAAFIVDTAADPELAADPECLMMVASAESFAGRYRDARRHAVRGLDILRRTGSRHVLPLLLNGLSNTYRRLGDLDAAQRAAAESARIAGEMGAERIRGLALALRSLSLAWMLPPTSREAVDLAEQATAAVPPRQHHVERHGSAGTGAGGRAARGPAPRGECDPRCRWGPGAWSVSRMCCARGATRCSPRRPPRAGLPVADWAKRAAEAAGRLGMPYLRSYAVSAQAYLLQSRGDLAAAAALFRKAAALFHAAGLVCSQAAVLIEAARCQPELARTDLALVRELARRCGAGRLLGDLDVRPSSPVVSHPMLSVLTRRERQIACMAGTGRKTKDIARSLAISPRTVDVHLTRIYRKLNVGTRTELARLIATISYRG